MHFSEKCVPFFQASKNKIKKITSNTPISCIRFSDMKCDRMICSTHRASTTQQLGTANDMSHLSPWHVLLAVGAGFGGRAIIGASLGF
jgi:hypothetical protein